MKNWMKQFHIYLLLSTDGDIRRCKGYTIYLHNWMLTLICKSGMSAKTAVSSDKPPVNKQLLHMRKIYTKGQDGNRF